MKNTPEPPATVAEYIRQQDRKTETVLRKLRAVILKAAPGESGDEEKVDEPTGEALMTRTRLERACLARGRTQGMGR